MVNGTNGNRYTLRFVNNWTGAVNSDWNEAGNWSCGQVPDGNTDVVIGSGSVTLAANGICRSLSIATGATLTLAPGVVLTITH
jgi:trimeric autotransporter adhesin